MSNCKPAKIPINPGIANFLIFYKNEINKSITILDQSAIGALILPVMHICLDLVYSVGVFSQFSNNSGPVYIELIKYVL